MIRRPLFALVILFAATVLSCAHKDPLQGLLLPGGGDLPKVVASYPTNGRIGIDGSQGIWLLFDREMDQQKTQSAFTLGSAGGGTTGGFLWEGTRMIYNPRSGLTGSDEFTMTLSKSAEASTGVNIQQDYIVRFFAQADTTHPTLTSSNPANGATNVATNQKITLNFSKPIDFSTISSGITISPAIVTTITQNQAKDQVIITPSSNLTYGTTYTVNLTTALKDIFGNSLQSGSTISFVVGSASSPPALTSATAGVLLTNGINTTGIDRNSPIVLQFSAAMNPVTTEAAISLSPAASWIKTWNGAADQLTLSFPSGLSSQSNYTLSVSNSASDSFGNLMSTNYSFPFYTDAAVSTRPVITSVRQEGSSTPGTCAGASGSGIYSALTDYATLDLAQQADADPGPLTACILQIRIDFSGTMVRNSLVTSTSFQRIFDASSGNVQIYGIVTPGPTSGNSMTVQLYGNPWPSAPGIPTYRLKILGGPSGAIDVNGNTLASDYVIYLTF